MHFKLITLLVELAALTHDLGKMNKAFQSTLWNAVGIELTKLNADVPKGPLRSEYARHELISYIILRTFSQSSMAESASIESLKAITTVSGTELTGVLSSGWVLDQWLQPDAMYKRCTALIKEDVKLFQSVLNKKPGSVTLENLILRLVAYLSLTHHTLPGVKFYSGANDYSYWDSSRDADVYFNKKNDSYILDCLSFENSNILNDAETKAEVGQKFIDTLHALQHAIAVTPDEFDTAAFVKLAFHFARPSLVMADYLGSGLKTNPNLGAKKPTHRRKLPLLGNTHQNDKYVTQGDELYQHVLNVFKHANNQPSLSLRLIQGEVTGLPVLSKTALESIDGKRSATGKFAWQHDAFQTLRAMRTAHTARPVFTVVTAETGSGKTIASAQIARALGSTRFTYCLGLRSLTLQTGESYRSDLGLTPEDLAVIIGDSVTQRAFNATSGSESLGQDTMLIGGGRAPSAWLDVLKDDTSPVPLENVFRSRILNLIDTPVVVSTIDQLIGITQLKTVSKAFLFLRIQSADLILDEVDNYSPDELKHIQSLCYFMGLSRKNVTCLSASMGYIHTEALLFAYREGLKDSKALTSLDDNICVATVSNLTNAEYITLDSVEPIAKAMEHVRQFNKKSIAAQGSHTPKVRHKIGDFTAIDYKAIIAEINELHSLNAVDVAISDSDTRKVSVGYVRMNTVGSARMMATTLFELPNPKLGLSLPDDTEIAVVCYHAKYSALEISAIDRVLNVLTSRKKLDAGQEYSKDAITRFIKPLASRTSHKNLIFIVVTTSLIETGRDHDYDWAVLEPNSHRSFIQSGGRVRRHRPARRGCAPDQHNLTVIQHPVRALKNKAIVPRHPANVWRHPGPLTYLRGKEKDGHQDTDASHLKLLTTAAAALNNKHEWFGHVATASTAAGLLGKSYSKGVSNALALQAPDELTNSAALLEQYVLHALLLSEANGPKCLESAYEAVSGKSIHTKNLILTDWAYRKPFRDGLQDDNQRVYAVQKAPTTHGGPPLEPAAKPVLSDASESIVRYESLAITNANRILLALLLENPAGVKDVMAEVLQQEVQLYLRNGFDPQEITHLSSYGLKKGKDQEWEETFYSPYLGYNHYPCREKSEKSGKRLS